MLPLLAVAILGAATTQEATVSWGVLLRPASESLLSWAERNDPTLIEDVRAAYRDLNEASPTSIMESNRAWSRLRVRLLKQHGEYLRTADGDWLLRITSFLKKEDATVGPIVKLVTEQPLVPDDLPHTVRIGPVQVDQPRIVDITHVRELEIRSYAERVATPEQEAGAVSAADVDEPSSGSSAQDDRIGLEQTPNELLLRFDLPFTKENVEAVQTAVEEAHWASVVLTEPAVLFLTAVIHTLPDDPRSAGRVDGESLRAGVNDLLGYFADSPPRPEILTVYEWRELLDMEARLLEAIHGSNDDRGFRTRIAGISADAAGLLKQIRVRLRPNFTRMYAGSIIASIVAAGAPTVIAIIGTLAARSVIAKNRGEALKAVAEAGRADADARKSEVEQHHLRVQTTKLQVETIAEMLEVIKRTSEIGDPAVEQVARARMVECLTEMLNRISPTMAEAAAAQLRASLPAFEFLSRHLDTTHVPVPSDLDAAHASEQHSTLPADIGKVTADPSRHAPAEEASPPFVRRTTAQVD